jgi:hypothetical protein
VVDDANSVDAAVDADTAYTACSTPFDSVSVNTLEAADFEVDREGWSNSGDFTLDSTEARLGNSSLHVSQGTGTRTSNREFPVPASTLFTVSASIKTTGVTDNGCRVRMRWGIADGTFPDSSSSAYITGTSDWTVRQSTGSSRSDTVVVRVQIECTLGDGEAWFDNIRFQPGNGPICGNLNCELDENCLADCSEGPPSGALFVDGFDKDPITERWDTAGTGTWDSAASSAAQADVDVPGYASILNSLGTNDYRVGAEMTRSSTDPDGSMALSLRGSSTNPGYLCSWQPGLAKLSIVAAESLASTTLDEVLADSSYSPDATFAVQAEAVGDQIRCCVHDVPGATLTVTDPSIASGEPGVSTNAISATFDSFTVVAP